VLLLCSSCAVPIRDQMFCAEIPGGLGAVCDGFLTSNQEILNQAQWDARKALWIHDGNAVECTTSNSVGNLKAEIEELCSKTACDYATLKSAIDNALDKIQDVGSTAREAIQ